MTTLPGPKRTRKGPVIVLVGGIAVGVMALSVGLKRRPASLDKKGKLEHVVGPFGSFALQVPAFLTHYGEAKVVADSAVVGLRAGSPERGNFVVMALSKPDASPFVGAGFEDWLGDAYIDCLATADSGTGRNWWAVTANEELQAVPYKMKFAVARNTIPLVSRMCMAVTNTVADVNVRFYAAFTGINYDRFAADLRTMVQSLKVEEPIARHTLGIGAAAPP